MSEVWLVLCQDGNVCCPALDLDSVWSSKVLAEARMRIIGDDAHIERWGVDGEISGLEPPLTAPQVRASYDAGDPPS